MNIILCSVSDSRNNDDAIEGLVHYGLTEEIHENDYCYAVYHNENKQMDIVKPDHPDRPLSVSQKAGRSIRYSCVYDLLTRMKTDDCLMAVHLSDFGESSEEAEDLYFRFLSKGIHVSVFDTEYLNTDVLKLSLNPSSDQKVMIHRMIDHYFKTGNQGDRLTPEEKKLFDDAVKAKKKSDS